MSKSNPNFFTLTLTLIWHNGLYLHARDSATQRPFLETSFRLVRRNYTSKVFTSPGQEIAFSFTFTGFEEKKPNLP